MCLVCTCYYCKIGNCDGHHFAHDAIRKLRRGEIDHETAKFILKFNEKMAEEEAETYLKVNKDEWHEELPLFKDDKGGTV